ncbi:MAG: peptidoglycan D,D-transpeptidase FtsI family protein [Actinomycetota bacterium]
MRKPPVRRLIALFAFLTFGLTGIVLRLAVLQVRDASAYAELAERQRVREIDLAARRGSILDRDRQPLAMSLDSRDVYADPTLVTDLPGTASILAQTLHLKERDVEDALRHPSSPSFVYIDRQVDLGVAERIEKMGLPGVESLPSSRRVYPNGPLASQVLGFVNVDGEGGDGLELQYEKALAGRPGQRILERDPNGHIIPQGVSHDHPPVPGSSVVTTIDKELQYRAQTALRDAVRGNRAKGGSLIVMDPRNGDVLAMATYPWFDPNHYSDYPQEAYRSLPITAVYEPGSVNKVITAAGAIEENVIPLTKTLDVPDTWQVSDHLFHDAHEHPPTQMTLADIISQSSNIGTIRIASMLGPDRLYDYLTKFGLGRKTGIGYPGEVDGILRPRNEWYGTDMGTIPVGQGVAATPLQMATVYATIANGGVWVRPRLVQGIVDPDGSYHAAEPSMRRRVISRRTDETLTRILAYAVEAGTGTLAQVPGYWVAGKTGTALIPDPQGGYYAGRYVASFIGFLPASRPRLVIAAILDQPVTEYGGIASAPLFQQVARYAIARLRIPSAPKPPTPPHAIPYEP